MLRLFKHYIPVSTLILLLVEAIMLMASTYLVEWLPWQMLGVPGMQALVVPVWPKALFVTLVMLSVMAASGLYHSEFRNGMSEIGVRLALAFAVGGLALVLLVYWLGSMRFGVREMSWSLAIAMLLLLFVRLLFFRWTRLGVFKPRILVLGTGSRAVKVDEVSQARFGGGVEVVGYLSSNMTPHAVAASRILPEDESLDEIEPLVSAEELQRILGDAEAMDGFVQCHAHDLGAHICCAGYYDSVGEQGCTAVQLAIRLTRVGLDVIEHVTPEMYLAPEDQEDDDELFEL